ncbi:FAM172 family protein homolog CG10038 [Plodia interpunctella]|uniref:FAM172 family protein homolog CG10038 n=1 Tax=Plodia interpunctella TaxID=58824 RepID=UPI0023689C24|nr:FAM172 family protein homolog CG10038 [Plodia interpunctella]
MSFTPSNFRQIRQLFGFSILKNTFVNKYCWTVNTKEMESLKTVKDLGYDFNAEGQLRKIGADGLLTSEPFQFNVSDKHQECQAHYEKLGDAITNYIYHLLETQENLVRLTVPEGSSEGTFIFVSKDYDKKDVLMILINGSGAVRAGQWARSLIINDCLDMGTQIPYIQKAQSKGYGVMVLNTNDNCLPNGKKIPHSSTAEEHARYIWDTYVGKANANSIVIVAHSYGGVVTLTLADQLKNKFDDRVKAIAFTDSVHSFSNIKMSKHFKEISQNWISSSAAVDTPMNTPEFDCLRVSAGHPKHEMTSYACMDSVFKFIEDKLTKK